MLSETELRLNLELHLLFIINQDIVEQKSLCIVSSLSRLKKRPLNLEHPRSKSIYLFFPIFRSVLSRIISEISIITDWWGSMNWWWNYGLADRS